MDHSREHFSRLYLEHGQNLLGYLIALVGDRAEAEDILQNVCVVLWERFDDFEPGTSFFAWARRVAYLKTLEYRRKGRRQTRLLSESFIEIADASYGAESEVESEVESEAESEANRLRERLALRECVQKLHRRDRELVGCVYGRSLTMKDAAAELGRPANTVYKAMNRIRRTLAECVRRSMRREEQ